MGNQPPVGALGDDPFTYPSYDGVGGHGFKRFITLRWPRSTVLPRATDESEASWLTRDEFAEAEYEKWLKLSWDNFLNNFDTFTLPYCTLIIENRNPIYNFPPDVARLRNPENITGVYNVRGFLFRSHFDIGAVFSQKYDWVQAWNYVENLYPYNETKDRDNFFLAPVEDSPGNDDIQEIKPRWVSWFKSVWPCAEGQIGYFDQTDEEIGKGEQGVLDAYDDWVEENFQHFWSRDPNSKNYWEWPLPYDVEPTSGIVVNKPPLQCQLRWGFLRTRSIIGVGQIIKKPQYPLGDPSYQSLWITMYQNLRIGSMDIFELASVDIDSRSDDPNHVRVHDPDYDGIGNYNWGPGGKIGRRYPPSFPPRYLLQTGDPLQNYGLFTDWPDPYDLVNDLVMSPSTVMPFPSEPILKYWELLVKVFQTKNPRLYVPRYSSLAPPAERKNYSTDRIGFKMYPEDYDAFFKYDTSEMEEVDSIHSQLMADLDKYIFSFCEPILVSLGVPKNPTFNKTPEYRVWSRAVLQAVHFRYAERHHFYPWENFINTDTSRFNQVPASSVLDARASDSGLTWDWPIWVWSDNFLTFEQKSARSSQTSPYDFLPFRSDILPWDSLLYLLKTIQERRSKGDTSTTILDTKFLDPYALRNFGLFVWHTRRQNTTDTRYVDLTGPLRHFLQVSCNISTTSSYDSWNRIISYLLNNMYDHIVNSSEKVELKKIGECIINPENITQDCIQYIAPDHDSPDETNLEGELNIVFNFWRNQWLETKDTLDWPTYAIYPDGRMTVLNSSKPVPGFWEKFWNTLFGKGYTAPSVGVPWVEGDQPEIVKGFVLPPAPAGKIYSKNVQDIYRYLKLYPMPVIRSKPPLANLESWNENIAYQWATYIDWVEWNVKAQKSEFYAYPNHIMKDKDGNNIIGEGGKLILNCFPSFGVFPINSQTDFNWIFDPGSWADNVFGTPTMFDYLISVAKRVYTAVITILKDLVNEISGLLDFWKILLIGGAVVGGLIVLNKSMDKVFRDNVDPRELAIASASHKRKRIEEGLMTLNN